MNKDEFERKLYMVYVGDINCLNELVGYYDGLKQGLDQLQQENEQLKEDMKVLFEENSNKEKVIIKQNEVIDKLNCMGDK